MRSSFFVFVVFALAFFLVSSGYVQQTAEQFYQSALYKEEVEGELQKAIEIYQKILKQFPENREVAAKAQLHIGLCYEKLGLKEAQKAFQSVIENYPEQNEAVKLAKEKLSVLLKAKSFVEKGDMQFSIQQVRAGPDVTALGSPSPDGRHLSMVDWMTGDLAVMELATGKKRRLTNKGSWAKSVEMALFSRFSPDGKTIAYNWMGNGGTFDLRIIGLDGSGFRVLYDGKIGEYIHPFDWSPDGKHVLAGLERADRTAKGFLISVEDGSTQIIKTFEENISRTPWELRFSPDGRYIAFDRGQEKDSPDRDIFLLSIDEGREMPLVRHSADDYLLGWAPDGKHILFASNRTGTVDAWIIPVEKGKPQDPPRRIKTDMGRITPMGFTRSGSFYYGLQTGMRDVYTASLDLETGKLLVPPEKVSARFVGANGYPNWSPDGKHLLYLSRIRRRERVDVSPIISIKSLETGEVRELNFKKYRDFSVPCWSPDGKTILIDCEDMKRKRFFALVDPESGEVRPLMEAETEQNGVLVKLCGWFPDGKSIIYWRRNMNTKSQGLLAYDLETKQERELYRTKWPPDISNDIDEVAFSPDGKSMVFLELDKPRGPVALKVMPAAGGEPRDVLRLKRAESITAVAWTPDGQRLIFAKATDSELSELWRVSLDTGELKKLDLETERMYYLGIHPDGKRITFSAGHEASEVWVMENFLPNHKNKK